MLSPLPEEFELLDRDSDKAGQKRSRVSNMIRGALVRAATL